jgi:hypothetical protein
VGDHVPVHKVDVWNEGMQQIGLVHAVTGADWRGHRQQQHEQ